MPVNTEIASKTWYRYAYCRDNGHMEYVQKDDKCNAFFRGDQWDQADLAALKAVRRPALTINKIISTIGNVMGEQIYNRSEISFRPRSGAPDTTAEILTKVFMQISDNNQLDWRRSDMFADGAIGSRGFLDVRIAFDDSMQGEVKIDNLNPKNVIIDPDADSYDPDEWNEVFTSKWVTADDIALLYSTEDAELLRGREQSWFPYGYDSIERHRDRFGDRFNAFYAGAYDQSSVLRNLRVIERQHRMLDKQLHFVNPKTGDMRAIPNDWSRDRIAYIAQQFGLNTTKKLVKRIRWTVICDNVVLHDDWSPYKHFTVVPYFPYFRRGKTIGLVENLLSPQELLNKVSSQELHVINTTANSGWKVKAGALTNMSIEELEQRGAQTGLVLEVNEIDGVEKIQPNTTPTGLDRITYKAEEHIKGISGVSDSMQGMDREDVAAKAIQAKRQAGSTNLVKPLDSLVRSDFILARNVLDLVQQFYTEERIITVTHDKMTGETEELHLNSPTPEGEVLNDLTLGEYDVVISSVPVRETLEDSQFDQAMAMREQGIEIPDTFVIENSRLLRKRDLLKSMEEAQNSPEAQAQAQLQQRGMAAEVAKTEAEATAKQADAGLKQAKSQKEIAGIGHKDAELALNAQQDNQQDKMLEMQMDQQRHEQEMQQERERFEMEMAQKQAEFQQTAQLKQQEAQERMRQQRVQSVLQAQQPQQQQQQPQDKGGSNGKTSA
jgi:hypothetical protein